MKTQLEQALESLSNEYETKLIEVEDKTVINSRNDIIKKIISYERLIKDQVYVDEDDKTSMKNHLSYWYKMADSWRE